MKLRIKGNSIRYRLTKSDVNKLANTGYLEEKTLFGNSAFVYALQTDANTKSLSAALQANKITLFVSDNFVKDWPQNEIVGIDNKIEEKENDSLYLLLEKDFVCLDETTEDQSDNYPNPSETC